MRIVFLLMTVLLLSCSNKKDEKVELIKDNRYRISQLQLRVDSLIQEGKKKLDIFNKNGDSLVYNSFRSDRMESIKVEAEISVLKQQNEMLEIELK